MGSQFVYYTNVSNAGFYALWAQYTCWPSASTEAADCRRDYYPAEVAKVVMRMYLRGYKLSLLWIKLKQHLCKDYDTSDDPSLMAQFAAGGTFCRCCEMLCLL